MNQKHNMNDMNCFNISIVFIVRKINPYVIVLVVVEYISS